MILDLLRELVSLISDIGGVIALLLMLGIAGGAEAKVRSGKDKPAGIVISRRALRAVGIVAAISALAVGVGVYVNYTQPEPPTVSLSPDRGPAGTTVTITGVNFGGGQGIRREVVRVRLGGVEVSEPVTVNEGGDFSTTFTVPLDTDAGQATVAAIGEDHRASTTFTVTAT